MDRSLRIAFTALSLFCCSAADAQLVVSGVGHAKDGDSLMVGSTEVRLYGIDAPELHQTCLRAGHKWACGAEAKDRLAALANGKHVECDQLGTDQYQRTLARCRVGDTDISTTMVALGYAVAFRRYSIDYVPVEENAKANRRGLWSGTFQMPSDYRHPDAKLARLAHEHGSTRRMTVRTRSGPADTTCRIKGNRNRKGEWIYHLPGMPYYEQTRPEEIFCTEAQARAAGYRRALVR